MTLFGFQPLVATGSRGRGGAPGFGNETGPFDQHGQALEGIGTVLVLAAKPAGFDDQTAVGTDAVASQAIQPFAHGIRQGLAVIDIEPQLHGRSGFIDVLPAGAAGVGELQVNVAFRNDEGFGDLKIHWIPPLQGFSAQGA